MGAAKRAPELRAQLFAPGASDDVLVWIFLASSGRFVDAEKFECAILPGACPMCLVPSAIVALPPPLLAEQRDGTTHVCHPALGGCNHGFEKTEG